MTKKNTLKKSERLTGEIRIGEHYQCGKGFICFPFRVVFREVDEQKTQARLLFCAPKRRLRHAVERNRMKRLMRETYRTNKADFIELLAERGKKMEISINYVADECLDYALVERKMKTLLSAILEKI